jgi:hypothetical protein
MLKSQLVNINNQETPWVQHHDLKTTRATIKNLLAGGVPDWHKHPNDYKQFAIEAALAEKEVSDSQVYGYRMDDQELLIDFKARYTNIIYTREFIRKLRINGVKCFTYQLKHPQQVGLWAQCKTLYGSDAKYICYMQVPCQTEWSVLRLDEHGLPNGEDYRGWRTVLSQLIKKEVITEKKANEMFGRPTDSIVSRRYRRTIWYFRNHYDGSHPDTYLSESEKEAQFNNE